MSEERLKEIKDSIYIAHRINCDPAISIDFRDKEELYYEVVRLREIINHAEDLKHIKEICMHVNEIDNLTLEQINGIDNE